MYPTDTSDQRQFKDLKAKTFQLSIKLKSHISDSTKNIMRDLLVASSHPLPNPEDQILQLTQGNLNLII